MTRRYEFSLDSNRTSLSTSGPDAVGACTTAAATTVTSTFDAADRITTAGHSYDAFGRSRSVPKVHTDQAGETLAGDLGVTYYANDMVAKLTQTVPDKEGVAGVVKTKGFTLDPARRLSSAEDATSGAVLRQTINHYADGGDAPAWVSQKTRPNTTTAWTETWSRNVLGPNGELALIQPDTGVAKIQITNLHGDVVTQLDNTTGTPVIDAYTATTEYGLPKPDTEPTDHHYGWLGAHRRSTDSPSDVPA